MSAWADKDQLGVMEDALLYTQSLGTFSVFPEHLVTTQIMWRLYWKVREEFYSGTFVELWDGVRMMVRPSRTPRPYQQPLMKATQAAGHSSAGFSNCSSPNKEKKITYFSPLIDVLWCCAGYAALFQNVVVWCAQVLCLKEEQFYLGVVRWRLASHVVCEG